MRFSFFVVFSGLRKYDYSGLLLYQLIIIMLMERNIPEYTYNINSKRQYDEKTWFFSAVLICWCLILSLPRFFCHITSSFVSRYTGDYDLNCLCILDKPGDRGCVW